MPRGRLVLVGAVGVLAVLALVAGLLVRAEYARYGDYATCMRDRGHEVSDPEVGLTGGVSVDQAGPASGAEAAPDDDLVAAWQEDGAACADDAGLDSVPGGDG